MLLSMTGYGDSVRETGELNVRVEIKSLNSRNLDLTVRVPKAYTEKEISLRSQLGSVLQRGKISLYIETESLADVSAGKNVNRGLLTDYYRELTQIADELGAPKENILPSLLSLTDILQTSAPEPPPADWSVVESALEEALQKFLSFRQTEGNALKVELQAYIQSIRDSLKRVEAQKDNRIERVKDDLRTKLAELREEAKIDENRFEQELIYYAEKLDITEEIVRLTAHMNYFMETLEEDAPGKKLGFIAQELGREINTIGAKANDAQIQRDIVLMKEELEKIKEQVLNVL